MKKILLVNNAEPGITEFAKPIERIIAADHCKSTFIEYRDCIDFDFSGFDGAILTGSPQGDDIVEHHLPYFLWLKEFANPVLGICAGHHITGFMFGAQLLRSVEPESGDQKIQVIKKDPIFKGLSKILKVRQMHNDSITVPKDFEWLASSDVCKNQLMKHKTKHLYTCQFHPEFYNHDLIQNFIRLC